MPHQVTSTTEQDFDPSGQFRAGGDGHTNLPRPLTIRQQFDNRLAELSDPNSELYRNAEVGLLQLLNQTSPTVATLTSAQRAGGLSVGSASAIGNKQRQASELKNRDKAAQGASALFQRNQGLINDILGKSASYDVRLKELNEMKRQFDKEMDASFWDNIVGGLIGVGSIFLSPISTVAGAVSGKDSAGTGYMQSRASFENRDLYEDEINDASTLRWG